jgi:hypothetical protein
VPAYAAFAWATLFAALSFYWAAGGDGLVTTLAHTLRADAAKRDAGFVATIYATAVLKLAAAALAISLVRPWPAPRLRRGLAWAAGVGLTLYGLAGEVEKILMKTGAIDVPKSFGHDAVDWYLFLWEPVWILGGVLFLLSAYTSSRKKSADVHPRDGAERCGTVVLSDRD